jgi:hypothetical protein
VPWPAPERSRSSCRTALGCLHHIKSIASSYLPYTQTSPGRRSGCCQHPLQIQAHSHLESNVRRSDCANNTSSRCCLGSVITCLLLCLPSHIADSSTPFLPCADGQAPHPPTDMAHQRAPELGATFVPGGWDDYSMPEVVAPSPQRYVFLSLFGLNLLAAPCLPAPVSPAS